MHVCIKPRLKNILTPSLRLLEIGVLWQASVLTGHQQTSCHQVPSFPAILFSGDVMLIYDGFCIGQLTNTFQAVAQHSHEEKPMHMDLNCRLIHHMQVILSLTLRKLYSTSHKAVHDSLPLAHTHFPLRPQHAFAVFISSATVLEAW